MSSDSLLRKLGINSQEMFLRYNRLSWYGHVERSNSWIKHCTEMKVEGRRGKRRPRKTWLETVNQEKKDWKLNGIDPASRVEWRKALRMNMGNVQPALSGL